MYFTGYLDTLQNFQNCLTRGKFIYPPPPILEKSGRLRPAVRFKYFIKSIFWSKTFSTFSTTTPRFYIDYRPNRNTSLCRIRRACFRELNNMSFLWSLKKLFSSKKNESRTESHPEKDLEEFRSVTNQTVQQISDIKSTMAAMAAIDRGPLDHQQFHIKLHSFVKHLKQNDALREYVHCIYPE